MATNKHATIRYIALNKCFRSNKNYSINDLLEFCNKELFELSPNAVGIKKRQLYEDIRFMESEAGYGIDLTKTKNGREVYYRYSDTNFSINNTKLNVAEAEQIKQTLIVLSRFKGMPQFEWIDEITARLESSFGLEKGAEFIIDFEENKYLKGREHISQLFNAILNKKVLKIQYQKFNSEKTIEWIFHPYFLKEFNNRWFCFGSNTIDKVITNVPLDRIIAITEAKAKYIKNETINFEEHFEDVVGVTVTGKTQKLIIKIQKNHWPYIKTKPLHASQTELKGVNNDDFVTITLDVKLNYELESLLLSHGEKLEVLEPLVLKEKIVSRAKMIK